MYHRTYVHRFFLFLVFPYRILVFFVDTVFFIRFTKSISMIYLELLFNVAIRLVIRIDVITQLLVIVFVLRFMSKRQIFEETTALSVYPHRMIYRFSALTTLKTVNDFPRCLLFLRYVYHAPLKMLFRPRGRFFIISLDKYLARVYN